MCDVSLTPELPRTPSVRDCKEDLSIEDLLPFWSPQQIIDDFSSHCNYLLFCNCYIWI